VFMSNVTSSSEVQLRNFSRSRRCTSIAAVATITEGHLRDVLTFRS